MFLGIQPSLVAGTVGCLLALFAAGAVGWGRGAESNPIVDENRQSGSTYWQWWADPNIRGRADDVRKQIKGYASATSVNRGGNLAFHVTVNPTSQRFRIKFYRLGWYGGAGGRYMAITLWMSGISQAECPTNRQTGEIECRWPMSYTLHVPSTWVSGFYLALLVNANRYANYVPFVVRDDTPTADILYQAS